MRPVFIVALSAVVACGSSSSSDISRDPSAPDASAPVSHTSSSSGSSSSVGMPGAGSDVESATEPCNKTTTVGSTTYLFAEHAYAGASAAELEGSVTVVGASTGVLKNDDAGLNVSRPPRYDPR